MMKINVKRFKRDRRGTIAVITAIVMFPMLFLAIGAPIDLARAVQLRSALQNAADSSSLAAEEDIANGATPSQACTMIYDYAVNYILEFGGPGGFATIPSTSPGVSCTNTTTGTTPTPSNTPNSATTNLTASLPASFTSYITKTINISVSATATGPQGFVTVCVKPSASGSADLSQAYYYLRNTNNTLTNADGSVINQADSPGLSTGPGTGTNSSGNGVEIADFLVDNLVGTPNVATTTYCDPPTNSQYAVTVKSGLGQRLGFEYVVVTGGHYPCYITGETGSKSYADYYACLSTDSAYSYNPYATSSNLTSGNVNGFAAYYHEYKTGGNISSTPLSSFTPTVATNSYGTPIGGEQIFYSTDYPTTYNTTNANKLNYNHLVAGNTVSEPTVSPVITPANVSPNDSSCYEVTSSGVTSVINGYGPASQGCLLSQTIPSTSTDVGYAAAGMSGTGARVYWGSSSIVCIVTDGSTNYNGVAYTPTLTPVTVNNGQAALAVTGTTSSSNVQQENMVIANSNMNGASLGPNVFHCPVNTLGNPYYPDPTCAELGGSTLQISWNDMGGKENDNGNSAGAGGDLYYTYSCQQPTTNLVDETALTQ